MLNYRDFKVKQINNQEGFAGELDYLTLKTDGQIVYIVKSNNREQSLNEYVAQHLLKVLGFYSINSELISNEYTCYGAVRYVPNLQRIYIKNSQLLSASHKKSLIEFTTINSIMLNIDGGEYFLTPDGNVCSLDYGEALVSPFLLKMSLSKMPPISNTSLLSISKQVHSNIEIIKKFCKKYGTDEKFDADKIDDIILNTVKRFADLDINLMNDFFDSIDNAFNGDSADIYRNRIKEIKQASIEYIEQFNLEQ